MPHAPKPIADAAAAKMGDDWKITPRALNVNDSVLARFEEDLATVLGHHVFSDVLRMKPDATHYEAGHQAGDDTRRFKMCSKWSGC